MPARTGASAAISARWDKWLFNPEPGSTANGGHLELERRHHVEAILTQNLLEEGQSRSDVACVPQHLTRRPLMKLALIGAAAVAAAAFATPALAQAVVEDP